MTTELRAPRLNFISVAILLTSFALALWVAQGGGDRRLAAAIVAAGLALMQAPRVAEQWERAVVLRLGRFIGLRGPGLFWVFPLWIGCRRGSTSAPSPRPSPPSRP